ncbi:unnamed protein product [Mytilus coruscus]|uniref:Uncharacterized protein n=1 Tax=Mytilus coruscus TaxID=42192 RepID=A0A6J8F346_MYTCO|nr:unnamed protein product [Mytilus coruscus]
MLICFYRDNFPNSQCLLHLTGSDCCEDFFSKNGQFLGNHHVYPYGQMYRNVSHMIRINQIEADDNAPKFAKAHIKQENVWKSQYPGGVTCSLRDYPALGEEVSAWKIGIRDTCNNNNHCNDDDLDTCTATDETQEIHDSQDEDSTYTPKNIYEPTSSEFMEMHERLDVAIDNFEQHSEQNDVNIDNSIPSCLQNRQRIDATLLVPGHGIQHKSTLVKLLNEDPNLSKDRLVRVRQAALPDVAKSAQPGKETGINLFEDFAYVDRTAKTFQIGRIQRMQRTIVIFLEDLQLTFSEYERIREDTYKINTFEIVSIRASEVICHVNLTFQSDVLILSAEELSVIEQSVAKLINKHHGKTKEGRATGQKRSVPHQNAFQDFEGSFAEVIIPSHSESDSRRSSRIRKQILYIT